MRTRSYVSPASRASWRARRASRRRTSASSRPSPSASRLRRITATARASRSTSTARSAPRESASTASAPLPAKRSSTTSPSSGPSAENSASRTRSDVGRVPSPGGACRRRPPKRPATTLMAAPAGGGGLWPASRGDRLALAPRQLVAQQRVLGRRELRVGLQQLGGAGVRALEHLGVVGQAREAETGQPRLPRPRQLALAAQLEVDLGQPETVAVLDQRLEPRRLARAEQQAQRRMLAAPDASAQLVQLRDPV